MSQAERTEGKTLGELDLVFLEHNSGSFSKDVDRLRDLLGAPKNPLLFPPHFLKSTFPKIGGKIFETKRRGKTLGGLFLFPIRGIERKFKVRLHVTREGENILYSSNFLEYPASVRYEEIYDPNSHHLYSETHEEWRGFDIGRPSESESLEIGSLQRTIWGSGDDFLYPSDIHSLDFNLATDLVARREGRLVAFLFGFYKYSDQHAPTPLEDYSNGIRVESQLMGVLPEYRSKGLGFELKRRQASRARQEGVEIINWTVDPLQFSNAILNFGKLRAIAYDFYADYYQFRNELNQVRASRFGITWAVSSTRVKSMLNVTRERPAIVIDMDRSSDVLILNDQAKERKKALSNPRLLAVEVPQDWTTLQKENPDLAKGWRETTDRLFEKYLGPKGEGYAICEVGKSTDRRSYLVAQKIEAIEGL